MTVSAFPPESPLSREITRLRILSNRLINAALNRLFDLTAKQSHLRRNLITVLLILMGLVFTYLSHPASDWRGYMRNIFQGIFANPDALSGAATELVKFLGRAITHPQTLRYLPILLLPYSLAIFFAARYLADIFELKNLAVARTFLKEVTLGGSNSKLVVRKGNISEEDKHHSPIVSIGGPGQISVALDTAILVERPDGRPRVIGPQADENEGDKWVRESEYVAASTPNLNAGEVNNGAADKKRRRKSGAFLEGFERIRFDADMAGIHLIDQFADGIEASARTKDGIPIQVTDVRFLFHVLRSREGKGAQPTQSNPYPFDEGAIYQLIYGQSNAVSAGATKAIQGTQTAAISSTFIQIKVLIQSALARFISSLTLGEFLASIAAPEVASIQLHEQTFLTETKELVEPGEEPQLPEPRQVPTFNSRPMLSMLLNGFNQDFKKEAASRGVEVQWVGVGAWKMPEGVPSQVIPAQHIDAWRLTLENRQRDSAQAYSQLERSAVLEKTQSLIREAPLGSFNNIRENNLDRESALPALITAYRHQLDDARNYLHRTGELRKKPNIVISIHYLTRTAQHKPLGAPIPGNKREEARYNELLAKIKLPHALEELENLEIEYDPKASRETRLDRILANWESDRK